VPDQRPTGTRLRPRLRLAELIGALSLATDVGSGLPFGQGLRAALIAVRLSEEVGLTEAEAAQAYYLEGRQGRLDAEAVAAVTGAAGMR
jgi:hypothetical protein